MGIQNGFFEKTRDFFQTEFFDVNTAINVTMCNYVMQLLVQLQQNDGLQVAVLLLMYFLLIGIFKMLLEVVSLFGVLVFYILKKCKIYRLEDVDLKGIRVR